MRATARLAPLVALLLTVAPLPTTAEAQRFVNVAPQLLMDHEGTGRGTVAFDYDDDGLLDVFQANSDGANVLYRQLPGGTFEDVTLDAGVVGTDFHWGVTAGDYDNDDDIDLYVAVGAFPGAGPNLLFRNDGGTFSEVAQAAGVAGGIEGRSTAPVWIDYDRDGRLDLFVANYNGPVQTPNGESLPCVEHDLAKTGSARPEGFVEESNHLYRNNGDGTFEDVTAAAGLELIGPSFGVTIGDYDNDGWSDLYVASYSGPNRLYHNEGNGTFRDVTLEAGDLRNPWDAMSPSFEDFDNDGYLDLFVSAWNLLRQDGTYSPDEPNRLYRNMGDGTFVEMAGLVGLDHHGGHMGMQTADIDFDGWVDVYLGSGGPNLWQAEPDRLYRNTGASGTPGFSDVTRTTGIRNRNMAHGVSFADFDGDGDLDFYVGNGGPEWKDAGQPNFFYINRGPAGRYLYLRLQGTLSNRRGLGAAVQAVGAGLAQRRQLSSGSGFGSQSAPAIAMGFGNAPSVDVLTVLWPSGVVQSLVDVPTNQRLTLTEPDLGVEVSDLGRSGDGAVRLRVDVTRFGRGRTNALLDLRVARPGGETVAALLSSRRVELAAGEARSLEASWRPVAPGAFVVVARVFDSRTGELLNLGARRLDPR